MNIRNNKGSFYALLSGLLLIVGGLMAYLLVNPIFNGTEPNGGFFGVAAEDMNIDNASGTTMNRMQATWTFVPWSFIIAGILTIVIGAIQEEPYPGYRQGYR